MDRETPANTDRASWTFALTILMAFIIAWAAVLTVEYLTGMVWIAPLIICTIAVIWTLDGGLG